MGTTPRKALIFSVSFCLMAGFCVLLAWVFARFFGVDYVGWYRQIGPLVGIATAALGAAAGGLDRDKGLISDHPLEYLGAHLQAAGLFCWTFGAHIKRGSDTGERTALDRVLGILYGPLLIVLFVGWLVLVVPFQYFLYLLAGTPARLALSSSRRVIVTRSFKVRYAELSEQPPNDLQWDASMRDKPVTLTAAFAAGILFMVDKWLPAFGFLPGA